MELKVTDVLVVQTVSLPGHGQSVGGSCWQKPMLAGIMLYNCQYHASVQSGHLWRLWENAEVPEPYPTGGGSSGSGFQADIDLGFKLEPSQSQHSAWSWAEPATRFKTQQLPCAYAIITFEEMLRHHVQEYEHP